MSPSSINVVTTMKNFVALDFLSHFNNCLKLPCNDDDDDYENDDDNYYVVDDSMITATISWILLMMKIDKCASGHRKLWVCAGSKLFDNF